MKSDHQNIANKLVNKLKEIGISAYIWHVATTGSVYIRFDDARMCSVRIGDHDGRNKLKYKYNLRSDISANQRYWEKDGDVWRFYLHLHKWKDLIPVLVDRHEKIQGWDDTKYNYTIPGFKKERNDSTTICRRNLENS